MRKTLQFVARAAILSIVVAAALLCFVQLNAVVPALAAQQVGSRPMPPDLVAPPSDKPEPRPSLPQNDQPQALTAKPVAPPASATPATSQPATAKNASATKPPTPASSTRSRRSRKAKPSPQPPPEPVTQTPPPPQVPATPQQTPPSPPRVTFENGLLTISANNSTLSDVLTDIRARTGANINIPTAATLERLFTTIGPLPPRDAVAKLLAGSPYDFILVGTPQDPGSLSRVMLTQRQAAGPVSAPPPISEPDPSRSAPLPGQSRIPGMSGGQPNNDEAGRFIAPGGPGPFQPNPAAAPPNVANPTPFTPTPGPGSVPTGTAPVQPNAQSTPPQSGQPQVKTPEQLLNELKQMQQKDQQQKPPKQ